MECWDAHCSHLVEVNDPDQYERIFEQVKEAFVQGLDEVQCTLLNEDAEKKFKRVCGDAMNALTLARITECHPRTHRPLRLSKSAEAERRVEGQ